MSLNSFSRRSLLAIAVTAVFSACAPEAPPDAETVILVHGLGRTSASMLVLETRLTGAGYRVESFGYPSRSEPVEDLVDRLAAAVGECCSGRSRFHFVTHSMGGVLVRSYLAERSEPFEGRVVMLSPPNQGSEIVDAYADSPLLRALLGPSGVRLGTDSTGIASELGPVDFSLGIITGDRSINPIGSWLIPGPDDGKVAVSRARVEGAADFIVVPATHTFIMNRSDVAEQVAHFLANGAFMRDESEQVSDPVWPSCDAPEADLWVRQMRERVVHFDDLAVLAAESFGEPTSCEGVVTAEFDGMKFGSLRLEFPDGSTFQVETLPPELSRVTLRSRSGFADDEVARSVLVSYAEDVGVEIDWTAFTVTVDADERVETYRDPDTGLNASAALVYEGGSLVEMRFSLAL
ncbi:MAG: hypothetical protein HKP01_01610 [Gemmatimonadetes bacterium]|nr:hypothetical protein [Gemmatimonadota bacterium]